MIALLCILLSLSAGEYFIGSSSEPRHSLLITIHSGLRLVERALLHLTFIIAILHRFPHI